MSSPPPPLPSELPPQPSLTGPVVITAVFTAVLFGIPVLLKAEGLACCPQNCCASVAAASMGMIPVGLYQRAGGHITRGTGFLVAFLGVLAGGLVGAILQAQFPPFDPAEVRETLVQLHADVSDRMSQRGEPMPFEKAEFISFGMWASRYFVFMVVVFASFLAGLVGLVAVARRRQPPPFPSPPS